MMAKKSEAEPWDVHERRGVAEEDVAKKSEAEPWDVHERRGVAEGGQSALARQWRVKYSPRQWRGSKFLHEETGVARGKIQRTNMSSGQKVLHEGTGIARGKIQRTNMTELQKVLHEETGVARGKIQRTNMTSGQGRVVEPWINEVRINVKNWHHRFFPTDQPTIFMAPPNIRKTDMASYDPSVVTIGPLYRNTLYSGDELENCKWRFLRCLLSRCGNGKDASRILDECLIDLKARDTEVRGCYSVNLPDIDSSKLATSMLLDGCFIIYLMLRRKEERDTYSLATSPMPDPSPPMPAPEPSPPMPEPSPPMPAPEPSPMPAPEPSPMTCPLPLELDLGLGSESMVDLEIDGAENFDGSGSEYVVDSKIDGAESFDGSGSEYVVDLEIDGEEICDGLLLGNLWTWNLIVYDLLKLENQIPFFVIRLIFDKLFKTPSDDPDNADQLTNLALNLFSDVHPNKSIGFWGRIPEEASIQHLLHLFRSSIVTEWQVSHPAARAAMHRASASPEQIPNATDLAMAGVKFKRKDKFDSFLDVSFKNGILEIPPLRIFDYSKSVFQNLIAFEQCYPDTNTDITIYANFMDSIIDTANDVKLLRMKGILYHGLSTDDEVASLFNQLCNQIHCDPRKNYLNDLSIKVIEYHGSRWHQWRAGLVRDYFSNPWVIISVLAAVLLLFLTIEQSFFTAFSYFRPPSP